MQSVTQRCIPSNATIESTGTPTRVQNIPEREFDDWQGVRFKEKRLQENPLLRPLLFYGADELEKGANNSYSASEFAKLPAIAPGFLTPAQVMFCTRGVLQTFYPRSEEEMNTVPHLEPLRTVLSYLQPLELPKLDIDEDLLGTVVRPYNDYIEKLKEVAEATHIGLFPGTKNVIEAATKECILEDVLTSLPFLSDVAALAANVPWRDLLTSEGQMVCWDSLHSRYLGLKTSRTSVTTAEFYMRLEHQIKLPRNVALDISPRRFNGWLLHRTTLAESSFPAVKLNDYFETRQEMMERPELEKVFQKEELRNSFIKADNFFGNQLIDHNETQDGLYKKWRRYMRDEDARLSCCQEEPDRAKSDVIAGIKVVDILTADQAKVLNALCESSGKGPQSDPEHTLALLFETTQKRSSTSPSDPTCGLGIPDILDIAQLLVDSEANTPAQSEDNHRQTDAEPDKPIDKSPPVHPSTSAQDISDSLLADDIVIYAGAYKRTNDESSTQQSTTQAFMYLQAAVYKLAALGIYDFPVFATATDGSIAVVYTAWGMRPETFAPQPQKGPAVDVYIASRNPPKFDIRNVNQVIQFATFLLHLRHVHAQRAAARFEEVRGAFVERLERNDPTLEWTFEQQREELRELLDDFEARQHAALDALAKLHGECASEQGDRNRTSSDDGGSLTLASDSSGQASPRSLSHTPSRASSLMEPDSDGSDY